MDDELKKALENIYSGQTMVYLDGEEHSFSPKFERKMNRILEKNDRKLHLCKRFMRSMFAAGTAAAVLGLALSAGAAATDGFTEFGGFAKTSGFSNSLMDFEKLAVINADGCPETVEEIYALTYLPEGINYNISRFFSGNDSDILWTNFQKPEEEMLEDPFWDMYGIEFAQCPKKSCSWMLNVSDYVEVSETKVNGHDAIISVEEHYDGCKTIIYWDNGDYVFRLKCRLQPEEAIRVAESARVDENAQRE